MHQKGPVSKNKRDKWENDEPLLRPHSHAEPFSDIESQSLNGTHVLSDKLMLAIPMAMFPMTCQHRINDKFFETGKAEALPD